MIRFESVTKRYGDTVAVDELDFVAPSGQITVLVGPSGCGKTTSLRMINRMIEPTSGRIFFVPARECVLVDAGTFRDLDLGIEIPPSPLSAVCSHEQWDEIYPTAEHFARDADQSEVAQPGRGAQRMAFLFGEIVGGRIERPRPDLEGADRQAEIQTHAIHVAGAQTRASQNQ